MTKNLFHAAIIIAMALLTFSCSPLSLVLNTVDGKGARTLCTSDITLFDEFDVALGAKIEKKDTVLAVLVTCTKHSDHGLFDKNDKLRMRLNDGQEITLTNLYDKEFDKEKSTETYEQPQLDEVIAYHYSPWTGHIYATPYTVEHLVTHVYTRTTTNSYALYLINKKQINDIIKHGVAKLRIEIEDSDCDMPHPEKAQAKFLKLYTFLHDTTFPQFRHSDF